MTEQSYPYLFTLAIGFIPISIERLLYNFYCKLISPVKNCDKQLMLSRDHFSDYLKQHDEKILSANCFIDGSYSKQNKRIIVKLVLKS